jgi:hypothetical protein
MVWPGLISATFHASMRVSARSSISHTFSRRAGGRAAAKIFAPSTPADCAGALRLGRSAGTRRSGATCSMSSACGLRHATLSARPSR